MPVRALAMLTRLPIFGAVWAAVLGLWVVAPMLIAAHRIAPVDATQWSILVAMLVGASALLGLVLSPFAAMPLLFWPLVRRRPYRDAGWVMMLAPAPLLVLAYVGAALFVEWRYFDRLPVRADAQWLVAALVLVGAIVGPAAVYRRVRSRPARPGAVLAFLGLALAVGAAVLPFRVATEAHAGLPDDGGRLVPRARHGSPQSLLLVGVDSLNWDTLRPLLKQGELPTFRRLIGGGMHGSVEALWPPYWSGAAWAALLTGHPREETRIYGDLVATAPGLPPYEAPLTSNVLLNPYLVIEWRLLEANVIDASTPSRSMLGRRPLWELLTEAGVRTGVIRFDFTYPPHGQAEVVVSNHAGRDTWQLMHARTGSDVVAPTELHRELVAPFADEVPFDEAGFARIVAPSARRRSARLQFELDAVRTAYDIDQRTIEAALTVRRLRPDLAVLALYLGGFDNVCHALWRYRFPGAYGAARPSPADVEELGPAVDRYLAFLDGALARLLATYEAEPNVIVVSDHGHEEALEHPLWFGWHSRIGAFVAHGPSVAVRATPGTLSYFDLVPTVADMLGFDVSAGFHGTSILREAGE